MRMNDPVALYGLINKKGRFAYVGATRNWGSRKSSHLKEWGNSVTFKILRVVDNSYAGRIEAQIIRNRKRAGQCYLNNNITKQSPHRKSLK